MSSNLEKAQQFMARCPGTTMMQADRYLGDANGNVDLAVEMFNENMKKSSQQRGGTFNSNTASSGNNKPQSGYNPNAGRMATLSSLNDKKGNEYYVGGGDNSGQAVVAPKTVGGGNNNDNNEAGMGGNNRSPTGHGPAGEGGYTKAIFDAARASGVENPEDFDDASAGPTVPFSGAGRRLGHTEGPSPVIPAVVPNQRKIRVTFYKDGFVIGDSNELRSMHDEAGKAFIGSIMKGYIPQELATQYPNTVIDVKLVDQSDKEFDAPNMFVAFAGAGHKLSATGASSNTPIGGTTAATLPGHEIAAPTEFFYDENEEPKGKIVIHTPDNRRCEHKVNPKRHTVNDLRYLAAQDIPGLITNRIDLVVRDIPPRKLTDFTQTLADAKCVNAVIMVRPFS